MKRVGVFYHPAFKTQGFLTLRPRLQDFPGALDGVLKLSDVRLYECPRATREMILKVHPWEMVAMVDLEDQCRTAYESVGGVVAGMEALARGELDRVFCFTGTGGHHAGRREFYDSSCFNYVVIAITYVREVTSWRRFAIIDTDALHGAGTMQLLDEDREVLHLCLCRSNYHSEDGRFLEVNVHSPLGPVSPQQYLEKLGEQLPRVRQFQPDLLLWYCGFNSHRDDYGSLGLTEGNYLEICDLLAALAGEMGVPLQVVLGGGSLHQVLGATIPGIIQRLAQD
jgi:acetoin utilization deacetylase AcuC-like enzyme